MFEQMETLDFTTYILFLCVNPNGYLKKLQGFAFNNGMSAVRCSAQEWGVPSYFSGFWKFRVSDFILALDYIIVTTVVDSEVFELDKQKNWITHIELWKGKKFLYGFCGGSLHLCPMINIGGGLWEYSLKGTLQWILENHECIIDTKLDVV